MSDSDGSQHEKVTTVSTWVQYKILARYKCDRTLVRGKTDMDAAQICVMIDAAVQSALVPQAQETANREISMMHDFERQVKKNG